MGDRPEVSRPVNSGRQTGSFTSLCQQWVADGEVSRPVNSGRQTGSLTLPSTRGDRPEVSRLVNSGRQTEVSRLVNSRQQTGSLTLSTVGDSPRSLTSSQQLATDRRSHVAVNSGRQLLLWCESGLELLGVHDKQRTQPKSPKRRESGMPPTASKPPSRDSQVRCLRKGAWVGLDGLCLTGSHRCYPFP